MKKNYNPYTVPEDFFEKSCEKAVSKYRRRARTIRYTLVSAAVVALLIVVPVFVKQQTETVKTASTEVQVNNLAEMYDYDIFLQVSF